MSHSIFERGLVFPSGFRESALRSSSPGRSPEPICSASACESSETSPQSTQISPASVSSSSSSPSLTPTGSHDPAFSSKSSSQPQTGSGGELLQDTQNTTQSNERFGSIPSVFSVTLMYPDTAPRGAWRPQLDSYLKRQSYGRGNKQSPSPYSRPCSPASFNDNFDLKLPSLSGVPSKHTSSPSEHTISAYTDNHDSTAASVSALMSMDSHPGSPTLLAGLRNAPASPCCSLSGADALSNFANTATNYGHCAFPRTEPSQQFAAHSPTEKSACHPVEPSVNSLFFQVPSQPPTPSLSSHSSSSSLGKPGSENTLQSHSAGSLLPGGKKSQGLTINSSSTAQHRPDSAHRLSLSTDRVGAVRSIPSPPTSPIVRGQVDNTKTCISCRSSQSPCWRPSWSQSAGQLCNSCGLRYKKTGARCLSASCNKIPCKGEFSLMLRTAQRDSSGRPNFACLKCSGPIEVRRD